MTLRKMAAGSDGFVTLNDVMEFVTMADELPGDTQVNCFMPWLSDRSGPMTELFLSSGIARTPLEIGKKAEPHGFITLTDVREFATMAAGWPGDTQVDCMILMDEWRIGPMTGLEAAGVVERRTKPCNSDDDDHDLPTTVGAGGEPTTEVPSPRRVPPDLAWSAEEPATLPLRHLWRLTWGHVAVLLAFAGVVALTVSVVAWALTRMHENVAKPQPATNSNTSLAAPPPPAWMPSTTTPVPLPERTTAQLRISSPLPGTDDLGWTAYPAARCDPGTTPAFMGRTTQSVVVVCEIQPGDFYYRGVRLSDGASIELANAVRSSAGFDVTNPSDGTVYRIRPTSLTISSPGGPASSEPMLKYASS